MWRARGASSRRAEGWPKVRAKRSAVQVEAERRSKERMARIGGQVRAMRERRKWSQQELGHRCGVGRMVVGRIERAEVEGSLRMLDRFSIVFDVPLAVRFDRDGAQEPADAGHLKVQETLLRIARGAGLERAFELATKPNDPWRSADVGLWNARHRQAIDAECWNTFGDIGAATRTSDRKRVELEQLAAARYGEGVRASLVWVVRDTKANRALIARYPEVFASKFTGSSRQWVRALTTGSEAPDGPGMVWCDTGTGRLHAWNKVRGSGS